ncbi:bifunctional glutamate N-acetyltransferase/amino-acid acetyltransferase ArgJ [Cryptosporangium phraense]|uniref:Arginine biosynthesis bifunctional protein ArgJ n=1 Tax=Cryptosporangium phraense TaxID=2593070 RepID=A0A545AK79_9ACTN|nr:bifunctional glutamate N-acetyltransferase/amino-acid acetyltransferase ArgJ [Cryptosporangium phraense]TQS41660.1 bifunctional glutamate N-acetyltransferase/amino-acid acetyltransferase ArgJ [Cryptosporangium phraense]
MSVTSAKGFQAAGVAAGLKPSGDRDVALVRNTGPLDAAAGVFTGNRIKAAPVLWSEQVLKAGRLTAVVLNSGGANACTGPQGFQDTHATAERVAERLNIGAADVAVCSTGVIGERLPMHALLNGVDQAAQQLGDDPDKTAAQAIITTDTHPKTTTVHGNGFTVGGMVKGAGMLAPALATMLCVLTTDAIADADALDTALRAATKQTFDRIDSDGCMSTNDTVLLLASGASKTKPTQEELETAVKQACADLAHQLIGDAEGASKEIAITVTNAKTEQEALDVARAIARNNLLMCALFGNDPYWGRVLAAIGTTDATFDPDRIDVSFNDVPVCVNSAANPQAHAADISARNLDITVDLHAGENTATVHTNDLTLAYVHENSAYTS